MQTRRATMRDVIEMQHCNLRCLPENYNMRYFLYHYVSWPQMLNVVEDAHGHVVGYVLAKMDDEDEPGKTPHGHITSLAVLRTHRKLGIAANTMKATMRETDAVHKGEYVSLHVRRTNEAALHLYQESLKFRCAEVDKGYYVDNEDAFHMKHLFRPKGDERMHYVNAEGKLEKCGREGTGPNIGGGMGAKTLWRTATHDDPVAPASAVGSKSSKRSAPGRR